MPNPRLTPEQNENIYRPLFTLVKMALDRASAGDEKLLWALRRKLTKELLYLERATPRVRIALKARKMAEQEGLCAICKKPLPPRGSELDRTEAYLGYTDANTRLVHHECHVADQQLKRFT